MSLELVWFFLWGLLWAIYFVLDGFDLGVGMLLPFIARNDEERRVLINTTGPVWDGNEVWLITAGGVTFAAFPQTYAVLFSAFYTAFYLLLAALIVRGVSFEFRSKAPGQDWRQLCDTGQFLGSAVTALLIGMAFANIFRGLPIIDGINQAGFRGLLNPYGILGGVFFIVVFLYHGALWLTIRCERDLQLRSKRAAEVLWMIQLGMAVVFLAASWFRTHLFANYLATPVLLIVPLLAVGMLIASRFLLHKKAYAGAWGASAVTILAVTFWAIIGLFPNMLPSTIDPAVNSIRYDQAASSPLTLKIMLGVVALFLPFVIGYQFWAYRLFWDKVNTSDLTY